MRRLSAITLAWRNYLYANPNGYYNNPEDLCARVSLIQDEREAILDQMLKDEPDMNQIQMSKEEIAYQVEMLEDMATEFVQYSQDCHPNGLEVSQAEILEDFKKGTESELYVVARDWREYADSANTIIQEFWVKFDYICNAEAEKYLVEQMMDVQMLPKEREHLQSLKNVTHEFNQHYSAAEVQAAENDIGAEPGGGQPDQQAKQENIPAAESDMELEEEMSREELERLGEEMMLEAQATQGMVMER